MKDWILRFFAAESLAYWLGKKRTWWPEEIISKKVAHAHHFFPLRVFVYTLVYTERIFGLCKSSVRNLKIEIIKYEKSNYEFRL